MPTFSGWLIANVKAKVTQAETEPHSTRPSRHVQWGSLLFAKLEYASFKGAALRSFQLGQVTEADFQQHFKGSTIS